MKSYVYVFFSVLITYLLLDFIWLGLVSQQTYQNEIGHLMRETIPKWPWITFYLLYSTVMCHLVVFPSKNKPLSTTAMNGALFGLAAYGAFNLTNYAILATWPLSIMLTDWVWGTFVSSVIAFNGALTLQWCNKQQ